MNYNPELSAGRCAVCGEPLGATQSFCPKCGTRNPNERLVCTRCGTAVDTTHDFCPECGQKLGLPTDAGVNAAIAAFNASVTQKKKKPVKTIAIVLAVLLIVGVVGGVITGVVVKGQKKKQAIDTYLSDALTFYSECASAGKLMEDVGNEIQSAWSTYVSSSYPYYNGKRLYDPNDAVDAAHEAQASNVFAIKVSAKAIQSKYNTLLEVPDGGNQSLISVRDAVKQTYRTYLDLFETVLSPEGNFSSWKSDFQSNDRRMANALGNLSDLLL